MPPKSNKAAPHRLSDTQKIIIVRLIAERKNLLFGKFLTTDGITYNAKEKAWKEIIDICKENYGFDAGMN